MSFSVPWDESKPAGSEDRSLGDDRIREFKTQIRERLTVDHHYPSTDDANTGYHEKSTYLNQASDPSALAAAFITYAKLTGSYSELWSRHENAGLNQLTLNGKLWIQALTMAGLAQGDVFFYNGSIVTRLGAGTIGQFLQSQGAGANPQWATSNVPGYAAKSDMINATDAVLIVTASQVVNHPGVAKSYCKFDGTKTGTNAPTAGYGVTSVTRNSSGNYTINLTTAMSNADYTISLASRHDAYSPTQPSIISQGVSSFTVALFNGAGNPADHDFVHVSVHGLE